MPSYYVEGRIGLSVGVEIRAKDLDDAVAKAKEMKLGDFITVQGDNNDCNFKIGGVYQTGGAPEVK